MKSQTLNDLGERRILKDIIPRFVHAAGDDCAIITSKKGRAVVTTDPVPQPAAKVIGGDDDPYWLGWLLVTINASDIAASGASPTAFVAALDLPGEMLVCDLERLLAGIRDSCQANGIEYVGGNLRESQTIAAVGTAIGYCEAEPLGRIGADDRDLLVVIGQPGQFWADALRIRQGESVDKNTSPVFSPVSQTKLMEMLHGHELLKCAMDTSDGLAPTLHELARVNRLSVQIDLPSMRVAADFSDVDERSERLWMGWGDWTVVAAVAQEHLDEVLMIAGSKCAAIGRFVEGDLGVVLNENGSKLPLGRLESERFAPDSWFQSGIDGYIKLLKELPLPS
ncbi:AIR synthase related protein [Citromicrobium bathyomarinum]